MVEAKSLTVRRVTEDDAVEVEVKEPTVRVPKLAAGPVEEPTWFPVMVPVAVSDPTVILEKIGAEVATT